MKPLLMNGDCLELMKVIPDNSIDMILCDLPYGTTTCKWDSVIPFDRLWDEYRRVCRKGASIVLTATEPFTSVLCVSNILNLREKLVWVKHKPSNFACGKIMHLKYHEDIAVFSDRKRTYNPQMQQRESRRVAQMQKGGSKKWNTVRRDGEEVSCQTQYDPKEWSEYNSEVKYPSTVINIPAVASNSREKVKHPTQKPVALMEYLIRTYSNEGDTVLDNCMGSGTTGVACANTGRNFIGMEMDDKYFAIAKNRVESAFNIKQQENV